MSGAVAGIPAEVVVGLDVGTTGVKAAAFGLGGPWRAVAIEEYPLLEPAPGHEVQDPARILAATERTLGECVAACGGARVIGISVSAAMHGLLALDADGRPLTPLLTWADHRAAAEAVALQGSPAAAVLVPTGLPAHPMTPLVKLRWLARHEPELWAAARSWVGLKDYLLAWLTGTLATEVSSAAGTGLLDLSSGTWSRPAVELCGLDPARLPPVLPTTAVLALSRSVASVVGLPAGTPVVAGAGDGPLASLGVGALSPGVAGLSLGTSGAVRMAVEGPRIDPSGQLFCYPLAGPVWVAGGAISNGAGVLRWAGGALAPDLDATGRPGGTAGAGDGDAALLELAAGVEAGSDGLVMLPFVLSERAPLWTPGLAGAFLGLRREHTRAHILRAAVEGVCAQMRGVLDRLEAVGPVGLVRGTGGAFRSLLWRELMAAALDRPFEVVDDTAGTALGAAALGLLALGAAGGLAEALEALSPPGTAPPAPVTVRPELVASFEALRAATPELLRALERTLPGGGVGAVP